MIQLSCTCVTGVIECLGFAGTIVGWPSLVIVLKKEEYFTDLCPPQNTSNLSGLRNGTVSCVPQDERFALIFTIGDFVMNFVTFASGLLLDRYGIMVTRLLAILLFTAGTLLIAFSTAASALLLFPALILIGVGGVFLLTTNLKAGILFGRKRSTVITMYTGAFGSAAIVFLVVKVVYEAGFSLKAIFLFISCLSVLHVLRTVFLLPWGHIPYPLPEGFTYG
ncbi:equilibrative nucleobase transporter 1-like [Mobula birostris]|uniref:equilibrative nucleobase transporter 1-like n=1 Tax=Mobula birostris TaxID=1983395 RepID=UPI003B28D8B9